MARPCLLLLLFVRIVLAQTSITGRVIDAATKEALGNVEVREIAQDRKIRTNAEGRFQIDIALPASLQAQAVGYRLLEVRVEAPSVIEILLTPDALSMSSQIDVKAGPFEPVAGNTVASEYNLTGVELRNLANTLIGDPLRALQTLPGVNGNNDLYSQFSLRGAPFNRHGIFYDGVLLRAPFHAVQGIRDGASLSMINGDLLGGAALLAGAPPPNFMDRTAGVTSMESRDGSDQQTRFRITANILTASALGEGPLGPRRNRELPGSWLLSFRRSFQQYIAGRVSVADPSLDFAFTDVQGKFVYRVKQAHTFSLQFFDGFGGIDRTRLRDTAGANELIGADTRSSLVRVNYRFAPSAHFIVRHTAAFTRDFFENRNRLDLPLARDSYGEWVNNTDINGEAGVLGSYSLGASFRRERDDGFSRVVFSNPASTTVTDPFRGNALRAGGYAILTRAFQENRLRFSAGYRFDGHTASNIMTASPFASAALSPWKGASLTLGWGQYAQYPEINQLFSRFGSHALLPERATHVNLTLDQMINEQTRLRFELYNRDDRDLLARPFIEPRLINATSVYPALLTSPWNNTRRGYARGWLVMLQRRSANKLTGWVSYSYGVSRQRDGVERISFYADDDQRHNANAYVTYRISPPWSVSARWAYGSGVPVPGFLEFRSSQYFLTTQKNLARLPAYSRLDLRVNRTITWSRWKMTIYGELINAFDRDNRRLNSFNGFNATTRRAFIGLGQLIPILPAGGATVEF